MNNRWFYYIFLWLFLPAANCLLPTLNCGAQKKSDVLKYARVVVDTLCSPSMHGRGYVNKGDSIAADYIKKEFEKFGIKPMGKEFYQMFTLAVNTFPEGPRSFYIHFTKNNPWGNSEGIIYPGKDFLIKSTASRKHNVVSYGNIIYINNFSEKKIKKISKQNLSKKIIVINECKTQKDKIKKSEEHIIDFFDSAECIIFLTNEKLTSEILQKEGGIPVFIVNSSVARKKISKKSAIEYSYNSKFIPSYKSQNILGYIKGTQYPDSFIVFSAHYDHLGQMGKDVYFPGANDNASGCAMLLNLAKYYSEHPPKYSVAFMAFGGEEAGLIGSKYYVEHPLFPLSKIKFLVNMDILGTGDEGIKVVNATEHKKEFDQLVKINAEKNLLPSIQPRGKAANSDHYFFEGAGVKTFFIYTLGGIKAYHDIYDRPETLPLTKFEEVYNLLLQFTDYLQK